MGRAYDWPFSSLTSCSPFPPARALLLYRLSVRHSYLSELLPRFPSYLDFLESLLIRPLTFAKALAPTSSSSFKSALLPLRDYWRRTCLFDDWRVLQISPARVFEAHGRVLRSPPRARAQNAFAGKGLLGCRSS